VDTQTRHALKTNSFAEATASGVNWVSGHRSGVIRAAIGVAVALVVVVGSLVCYSMRTAAANAALGAAIDTYNASLAEPGIAAGNGVYATAADRSRAANKQFSDVAGQYGLLPEGAKAHYFAGITAIELGQTGSAETELKSATGAWNRNVANLAKLALANLYHQTQRDALAIDLYNELFNKPSETVPAAVAQLDLADLYAAGGKQDQARALWAKVKDADKDGMAGQIAAQKLGGH
jgi:tetratricopeptide (TPR) repeat protein